MVTALRDQRATGVRTGSRGCRGSRAIREMSENAAHPDMALTASVSCFVLYIKHKRIYMIKCVMSIYANNKL